MDLSKAREHLEAAKQLLKVYPSFPDALQVKRALDEILQVESFLTLAEVEVKDMLALFPAEDFILHQKHKSCSFDTPHSYEVCGLYTPMFMKDRIIANLRQTLTAVRENISKLERIVDEN